MKRIRPTFYFTLVIVSFISVFTNNESAYADKSFEQYKTNREDPFAEPEQPPKAFVPEQTCLNVNARQGWQTITANHTVVAANSEGGWSVDARLYPMVGFVGHEGSAAEGLAPFNEYKYDSRFPFGALLIDTPNHGVVAVSSLVGHIVPEVNFPAGSTFRLRINDGDSALGDNEGYLRVCLVPALG